MKNQQPMMNGEDVEELQEFLKQSGYDLEVDGYFGPQNADAVKQYQQDNGLDVDGIVGPDTRDAIKGDLGIEDEVNDDIELVYDPTTKHELSNPDVVEAVKELGNNLDATKVVVTGGDRTEEEQKELKKNRDTKTPYSNCTHGSKKGYIAADVKYYKDDEQIPPEEVAREAETMDVIGGVGTYNSFTHIDLRDRKPDGSIAKW